MRWIGVGSSEAKRQQGNFSWGQCCPGAFAFDSFCFSRNCLHLLVFSLLSYWPVPAPFCLLSILSLPAHFPAKLRATVLAPCVNHSSQCFTVTLCDGKLKRSDLWAHDLHHCQQETSVNSCSCFSRNTNTAAADNSTLRGSRQFAIPSQRNGFILNFSPWWD